MRRDEARWAGGAVTGRGRGRGLEDVLPQLSSCLVLCLVAAGCKQEQTQPLADLTLPARPFLYEAEFAQTSTLAALPDQVIVVDLEPTSAAQATAENLSRHELDAGDYRFCIDQTDPELEHMRLEDREGHAAVDFDASAGCVDVHLNAGTYLLKLRHRGVDFGGAHRVAFVRRMSPSFSPLEDLGVPLPGWWALAPEDPTGKGRLGRLHAEPPERTIGNGGYVDVEPIVADFGGQAIDDTALFDFSHLGGDLNTYLVPQVRSGPYPLDLTVFNPGPSVLIADTRGVTYGNKFVQQPLKLVDLGNGNLQLQAFTTAPFFRYVSFWINADSSVVWTGKPAQIPFMNTQTLFRILFPGDPHYAQATPAEGEVALYQGCNYTGPVAMFSASTPDLSVLTSPDVTLDRTTASLKVGPNAVIVLFSEANYGGARFGSTGDQPCLDGTSIGRKTRSFRIAPALPIFLGSAHRCEGCNLSGVDLTGVNGTGAILPNANLSGATLNHTNLHAAQNLVGTNFSGATIACSDFSGTDAGVVDLTQTSLSSAVFDPNISSCRSNFSNTKVDVSYFSPTGLALVDLTQAQIVLSPAPPTMDLSGASWRRATVGNGSLQGVHFGNAVLDGAQLQSVDLGGAVFAGASLTGVSFTGSKIDGSNLQDAGFQGTIFTDTSGFQTAVVTGVNFTGATFGGTGLVNASLEQVTLDGATFTAGSDLSGARFNESSMQGVDLHAVRLYGANFTRANLQNSNLAGALLSNNPDAGVSLPADFTGAHLKDVNLSSAQLQGTIFHFASLYGSFNVIEKGPPVFPCVTDISKCPGANTGFTCSCASAVGANMTRTDFTNAFLYGVDFSGNATVINGVDFSNAILAGANFDEATFQVDSAQGGAQPNFEGAFLQGTNLSTASLDTTSFANAYIDVEPNNKMQVLLGPSYTGFNGWSPPNQPVCVRLDYSSSITQVPVTSGNTTCPDGLQHPGGCGAATPRPNPNPHWASPIAIGQASPPGYYLNDATYTQADQSESCNNGSISFEW